MPFRFRRSRRPRRRFSRRTGGSRIARIAKKVFNRNVENKYTNLTKDAIGVTTTGALTLLNGISQGAGSSQRIGHRVSMSGVRFIYSINGGDATNTVRVMLLWSRAQVVVSQLPAVNRLVLKQNQSYKILYDKTHRVGTLSQTSLPQVTGPLRQIWRKIGGSTNFLGDTNTIKGGFLYVYLVSDSLLPSHPTFDGQFQISYQDA